MIYISPLLETTPPFPPVEQLFTKLHPQDLQQPTEARSTGEPESRSKHEQEILSGSPISKPVSSAS